MIHLDTHVALWLYVGVGQSRIPDGLLARLEVEPVAISPMARLELCLLSEVGRFTDTPARLLAELGRAMQLEVDATPFAAVSEAAEALTFTRDPFDRLIAAQSIAAGADLATKDRVLRTHLHNAVWG